MSVFQTTRRTILQLIGSLPIFRAAPSKAADTFSLIPALAPGQVMCYQLESRVVRNSAMAHRTRSTVTLEIVEDLPDGWRARWTSTNSTLLEADPRMRPLLEVMLGLWNGASFDLLLDCGGRVVDLADHEAVRALGEISLERIVAELARDPQRAPMAAPIRAALAPTLAEGGLLAQSLLKEPRILLGAMGQEFRVGEPLEVRTRIPSPLGTGEIPVLGRYKVRGLAPHQAQADIGWLMVIDRAGAAQTVGDEINALLPDAVMTASTAAGQGSGRTPREEIADALSTLDFDDRGDYIVDTTSAWPIRVRHERQVSAGAGSHLEAVEFTPLGDWPTNV
ncbi:MAG: hypothetical protein C4K60_03030 [Ideonella sp. MAG2]|nr:MAG: hypothetical protein C4K60_03030 [Ideonella sp. MAG2]